MTTSQVERFKEQLRLYHNQQSDQQVMLNQQNSYPYGPYREVLWAPIGLALVLICIGVMVGFGMIRVALLMH